MAPRYHRSVLQDEVVTFLALGPGKHIIDGTVGDGGHAEAMLTATAPNGSLLGLDLDPDALETSGRRLKRFGPRVVLQQGNFRNIADLIRSTSFPAPDAILFDLGLRSFELESSGRGFSFMRDEPLDMRFDPAAELTAAALVNSASRDELVRILREYGEERHALAIASRIVAARRRARILSTGDLVRLVGGRAGRIHPATRTFQALRIATNDELGALRDGIAGAFKALRRGGRLAIVSFHSREDRIVKRAFQGATAAGGGRIITHKPIMPTAQEVAANPRARSAKLRVFQTL